MSGAVEWVVLELTPKSDGEDPDVIRASIRHRLRDADVFIPASVIERGPVREFKYLVDGYAFVRHTHPESHYARLQDTKYVLSPLYQFTGRKEKKLATVTDAHIERFRKQIEVEVDQGIEVGDTVLVTSGPYKNIPARVCEEIPEQDSVVVHVQLRSTTRLVTLPRGFLRLESKSPYVQYRDGLRRLSAWAQIMVKVSAWPQRESMAKLQRLARKFAQLDRWVERRACAQAISDGPIPDLKPLLWGFRDSLVLDYYHGQVSRVQFELDELRHRKSVAVNLIVDGTQLFVRCEQAQGLAKLKDKQGRPTGAIVGFLRALQSYKKRFPASDIYVCWDGTSDRRRALFAGHKRGRGRGAQFFETSFGMQWLQETLPMLGIYQAFNLAEEADDVMATLARSLRESPNILITSDRDLLQLVSDATYQLCPGVGGGKEKLYDPIAVELEYGVPPAKLVHLRALSGDRADKISGVPGIGLKVASQIIRRHGSIEALYKSGLRGVSASQAARLRAHETQVRLNVEPLGLDDVGITRVDRDPSREGAAARLRNIAIRSEPIVAAFLP